MRMLALFLMCAEAWGQSYNTITVRPNTAGTDTGTIKLQTIDGHSLDIKPPKANVPLPASGQTGYLRIDHSGYIDLGNPAGGSGPFIDAINDCGAVADGTTDQTTVMHTCVHGHPYSTIVVRGTVGLGTPLAMDVNGVVIQAGYDGNGNQGGFKAVAPATGSWGANDYMIVLHKDTSGIFNSGLSNIYLDANGLANNLVKCLDCEESVLHDVTAHVPGSFAGWQLLIDATTPTVLDSCKNSINQWNTEWDNSNSAGGFYFKAACSNTVEDSWILYGPQNHGIVLEFADNNQFRRVVSQAWPEGNRVQVTGYVSQAGITTYATNVEHGYSGGDGVYVTARPTTVGSSCGGYVTGVSGSFNVIDAPDTTHFRTATPMADDATGSLCHGLTNGSVVVKSAVHFQIASPSVDPDNYFSYPAYNGFSHIVTTPGVTGQIGGPGNIFSPWSTGDQDGDFPFPSGQAYSAAVPYNGTGLDQNRVRAGLTVQLYDGDMMGGARTGHSQRVYDDISLGQVNGGVGWEKNLLKYNIGVNDRRFGSWNPDASGLFGSFDISDWNGIKGGVIARDWNVQCGSPAVNCGRTINEGFSLFFKDRALNSTYSDLHLGRIFRVDQQGNIYVGDGATSTGSDQINARRGIFPATSNSGNGMALGGPNVNCTDVAISAVNSSYEYGCPWMSIYGSQIVAGVPPNGSYSAPLGGDYTVNSGTKIQQYTKMGGSLYENVTISRGLGTAVGGRVELMNGPFISGSYDFSYNLLPTNNAVLGGIGDQVTRAAYLDIYNNGSGNYGAYAGRLASGTQSTPTLPASADMVLVGLHGIGWTGSSFGNQDYPAGSIDIKTKSAWTTSSKPTYISFVTTPQGAYAAPAEVARITDWSYGELWLGYGGIRMASDGTFQCSGGTSGSPRNAYGPCGGGGGSILSQTIPTYGLVYGGMAMEPGYAMVEFGGNDHRYGTFNSNYTGYTVRVDFGTTPSDRGISFWKSPNDSIFTRLGQIGDDAYLRMNGGFKVQDEYNPGAWLEVDSGAIGINNPSTVPVVNISKFGSMNIVCDPAVTYGCLNRIVIGREVSIPGGYAVGVPIHVTAPDASSAFVVADSFGSFPAFIGRAARGTGSSPAPLQAYDSMASLGGRAWIGSDFSSGNSAKMDFESAETTNDSGHLGSLITFETTPTGSGTRAVAGYWAPDGHLGFGDKTAWTTGAGIRSNSGNMEYRNSGGSWTAMGGGGSYSTIQNSGSPLTQRTTLNFTGSGVSCAEDSGKTTCTITSGSGGANQYAQSFWSTSDGTSSATYFGVALTGQGGTVGPYARISVYDGTSSKTQVSYINSAGAAWFHGSVQSDQNVIGVGNNGGNTFSVATNISGVLNAAGITELDLPGSRYGICKAGECTLSAISSPYCSITVRHGIIVSSTGCAQSLAP